MSAVSSLHPAVSEATASAAPRFAAVEARRALAFRTAHRHTRRVRLLRRLLIGGVMLFVGGTLVITIFDPFGRVMPGVAVSGASIDGTKVTMVNPKMAGYRKDGRPYAIEAARAVQDIKAPTLVDLFDLKARLTTAERSQTRLIAALGHYNSTADTMTLDGGAHVIGDNGLDATTQDGLVEFKTSHMITGKPVDVRMPGKRITADGMEIVDGGRQVTFTGRVHTEVLPASEPGDAAPSGAPASEGPRAATAALPAGQPASEPAAP